MFVIGVLVGAVLATGAFFIYTKVNPTNNSVTTNQTQNLPGGNPPDMQNGERPEMNGEQPPELPDGEKPEMNGEQPSKKSNSESTDKTNSKESNSNTSTESN